MYTEISLALPMPSAYIGAHNRGRSNSTPNAIGYDCPFESECSSPTNSSWLHRLRRHRKSAPTLKKVSESSGDFLTVENDKHRSRPRSPSASPQLLRKISRKLSLTHEVTLQWAVENEDLHGIKKVLSDSQEDINELKAPGMTPFHQACAVGNIHIVQLLVEHGANVLLKTDNHLSPVQIAVMTGNYEVAQYLVNHGADSDDIKNGF